MIKIDILNVILTQKEQMICMKMYQNNCLFSEFYFDKKSLIMIDFPNELKFKSMLINPNESIEFKFHQMESVDFVGEIFFVHKIHLIEIQEEIQPVNEMNSEIDSNSIMVNEEIKETVEISNIPEIDQIPEGYSIFDEFPEILEVSQSFQHFDAYSSWNVERISSKTPQHVYSHVSSWSVEKVCQWIRRLGSIYEDKKFDSLFTENGIDGNALMHMDKSDLKEMGINLLGDRIKIMAEINKLK
jgi:hypothetical protein